METPLPQLALALKDKDLWCHFGFLGLSISLCAGSRAHGDYASYAHWIDHPRMIGVRGIDYMISYDGGWYISQNEEYPYEDLYCHANRWMKGQGYLPRTRDNVSAWKEAEQMVCSDLATQDGIYPQSDLTMGDLGRRSKSETDAIRAVMEGKGYDMPTAFDMRRHAYVKCLMGGAGCDMAYCQNFCLLPDNTIGRTEAECSGV